MRSVTIATLKHTQGYGRVTRPAAHTVYRAVLHETADDCAPSCGRGRRPDEPIGLPHAVLHDAAIVAYVTPLCSAPWITADLAERYATPDAPAFDFADTLACRDEMARAHQRTHPAHWS